MSPAEEDAARAQCERVRATEGVVPPADVAAMVTASIIASFTVAMAEDLCRTVNDVCRSGNAVQNRLTCRDTGVIPAVVAAMFLHGAVSADVASRGCWALGNLALANAPNADAIAGSARGLPAILSVMASHSSDETVQMSSCWALSVTAGFASPAGLAIMRETRAVELINRAKERFKLTPDTDESVTRHANIALVYLNNSASTFRSVVGVSVCTYP